MKNHFDLAQWALVNLPLAMACLVLAGVLGYLLWRVWQENGKLRAERDAQNATHAAKIEQLNCTHQADLTKLREENKSLTDRYHNMGERNIDVLTALDRTISESNALPYLHEMLPQIQAGVNAIGAEMNLKPHQMRA